MSYFTINAHSALHDAKYKRSGMKYSEKEIPDGDEGIDVTVDNMKEMALRDQHFGSVRKLARQLRDKTDIATIRNIYDYVQENVEYESDPPDKELLISPRHVLSKRHPYGDCDDMTMALAALYLASDFKVRFRVIEWKYDDDGKPIPYFTHVYPLVYVPSLRAWIPTDAVIEEGGGFGNEQGAIRRRKDYPITLDDIAMATLARLDDKNVGANLRDANGQPCKGKKKKRTIVFNVNNSNTNTINAGNTTSTSRVSSPEDYSRNTYQNQQNPRTQTQIAPQRKTTYSPHTQVQNNPRTQTQNVRRNGQQGRPQGAPAQRNPQDVPQNSQQNAPQQNRQEPRPDTATPSAAPSNTAPNKDYGARPQQEQAPVMGYQNFQPAASPQAAPPPDEQPEAMRPPPREFDAQFSAPQSDSADNEEPMRNPPREFDERLQPVQNEPSAAHNPPREFDERLDEIPNTPESMRPPPDEFDERLDEVPNTVSNLRPPPHEFDEHLDEIPNTASNLRPPPREFDAGVMYHSQEEPMRPPPPEFG